MKWVRTHGKLKRCALRGECMSPQGHYGPCLVQRQDTLVFVDADGAEVDTTRTEPLNSYERKRREQNDPRCW